MNDRSPASPLQTLVWVTKVSQTNTNTHGSPRTARVIMKRKDYEN